MTSIDRTPAEPDIHARRLGWLTAVTGLLPVAAAVILAAVGQTEAAAVVAVTGSAVTGTQVTVNIRR
ncbi:hypothetical protein [Streptomyces mirabilis]